MDSFRRSQSTRGPRAIATATDREAANLERCSWPVNPYQHITPISQPGVLVLRVELTEVKDYMLAEALRYELVHAVRAAKSNHFILDMGKMEFITSLACVALIGLKHAVRDREGRLILTNLSEFIEKVLSAKRLLSPSQVNGQAAFEQAETVEAALERFTN